MNNRYYERNGSKMNTLNLRAQQQITFLFTTSVIDYIRSRLSLVCNNNHFSTPILFISSEDHEALIEQSVFIYACAFANQAASNCVAGGSTPKRVKRGILTLAKYIIKY